jgi:hypothetical protein
MSPITRHSKGSKREAFAVLISPQSHTWAKREVLVANNDPDYSETMSNKTSSPNGMLHRYLYETHTVDERIQHSTVGAGQKSQTAQTNAQAAGRALAALERKMQDTGDVRAPQNARR